MCSFLKKYETCKETGYCDPHFRDQEAVNRHCLMWTQMLNLANKDFKAAIRNMFENLKEIMVKEFKNSMITTFIDMNNLLKGFTDLILHKNQQT